MGHRMSSLPVAQYCGAGPELDKLHGAGRAALLSTCLHAKASGAPEYADIYARLSPEEQKDVDARIVPTTMDVDGVELRYPEAQTELAVGLNAEGEYTHVPDDCVTLGHLDAGWAIDACAYITDIKATGWTVPEGTDSLQLHAYGIAFAGMMGLAKYRVGLFFSDTGRYSWGEEVDLFSDEGEAITARVMAAAQTPDEFSTGGHCAGCYARLHCPEYMVPAANADTWLAPLVTGEITAENAETMLERLGQAKEVVKAVESALKVYSEREGGIPSGGLVWKPVYQSGRKSLNRKLLDEKYPGAAEECTTQGKGHNTFRRVKPTPTPEGSDV